MTRGPHYHEVSHEDILAELQKLRNDITPLSEMQPDLKELVGIMQAMRVGAKGAKWLTSIATALVLLGGLIVSIRGILQSWWHG